MYMCNHIIVGIGLKLFKHCPISLITLACLAMVILGPAHRSPKEQHSAEYEAYHMSQVRKRDNEALASIPVLFTSNKAKKNNASHAHAEGMHMLRSDKESSGREAFDVAMVDANQARSSGTQVLEDPPPKFRNGHSCIQWWAS